MKWMGKRLIAAVLCWMLLGNLSVWAEEENATIDFVLVMDCTGSLANSDPLKLGVEAAKLFVETLPVSNVRVSVIGFGAKWDEDEIYIMKSNGTEYELVTEAFPLSESGSEKQNAEICKVLDRIGEESGDFTQVGYALASAVDVLEQGRAAEDSACIILVSDGRVTGQSDWEETDKIYTSIKEAVTGASAKSWPVYCLELNYDGQNEGSPARDQLNYISQSTGGARIEVKDTDAVHCKFTEIIARYFDVESDSGEIELQDGKAEKRFKVEEITAETNIIITGKELERIERIAIIDPDGNECEYQGDSNAENRRVVFNAGYSIEAKLLNPKPGWWEVIVYGDDGAIIEVEIIPLREVKLELNSPNNLSREVSRNEEIEFTAYYIYNDQPYSSDTFYRDSKAYLEILETGEKFPMQGGTDNYKGTVSFKQAGNYTVRAAVEDGIFRNDRKVSTSYNIVVKAKPILSSAIPDQSMAVGSDLTLDCSDYFSKEGSEQVTYGVDCGKDVLIDCDISQEGVLTIKAGEKTGTVQITVSLRDVDLPEPATQQFSLDVTNERPQLLGARRVYVELKTVGNAMQGEPSHDSELQSVKELDLSMYFADPEDLPLQYGMEMEESMPFSAEVVGDKCVLRAEKGGGGTICLQAIDCCGEISDSITVYVKVFGSGTIFLRHTWWIWVIPVFAVIFWVVVFGKRRLYGKWSIIVDYGASLQVDFSVYEQGKKTKCRFSDLINAIQPCNFQSDDVMIYAGNRITKKVILKGLDKCAQLSVKKNDEEIKGISTVVFSKDSHDIIELKDKNGIMVRLERIGR